jgi:hypothetical protein
MQYGTAHLTWKGHGFYPGVGSFFSYAALLFLKLFSAAQQNIFSSISPELHCWHILDSRGVPLYINLIQYGDDVMIFEILLGFSWTQNYVSNSEFRRNIKER